MNGSEETLWLIVSLLCDVLERHLLLMHERASVSNATSMQIIIHFTHDPRSTVLSNLTLRPHTEWVRLRIINKQIPLLLPLLYLPRPSPRCLDQILILQNFGQHETLLRVVLRAMSSTALLEHIDAV